jgi:hypothetical protein
MFSSTNFLSQYDSLKATSLKSRVLSNSDIEPLLSLLSDTFDVSTLGHSEIGLPIHGVKIGSGPKRILLWSQMHGNESTTTKALFDLFNYLKLEDFNALLGTCTLFIIPILNPDGAKAYTRLNANKVDLNRDAINRSQKESIILRSVFNEFKPHYCFNLHGQRTIFSAGKSNNSSVISFLSPSEDAERTVTITRKKSMSIIHSMNGVLQIYLPNQIGRYDDGFNANCVGDQFQTLGVPTVLFEAGHYPGDYSREETRKYIALSIFTAIECIAYNKVDEDTSSLYFDIPENDTLFNDVIIRNALLDPSNPNDFCDIGIQHKEVLGPNGLLFKPTIDFIGDLSKKHGHMEINANFKAVSHPDFSVLSENYEIDFLLVEFVKKALFIENNLT